MRSFSRARMRAALYLHAKCRVILRSPDVQIGTERRSCYNRSQPLHLSKQQTGTKIETGSRQRNARMKMSPATNTVSSRL